MDYTLSEVLNNILAAIQDTLYYVSSAIAENASVIATALVVGGVAVLIARYGRRIFSEITGFFRGLF